MTDRTLYKCASPTCPGLPYKASDQRHPCPSGSVATMTDRPTQGEAKERTFPIVHEPHKKPAPHPARIPWSVAEMAYSAYVAKYGSYQSLERLAERGGFYVSEMDAYLPDWRERCASAAPLAPADRELREQYWFCAECDREVQPVEVTHAERHESCGSAVFSRKRSATAVDRELREIKERLCEHGRVIPDDDYMACDECTNQAAAAMREKVEQLKNTIHQARIEGARLAIEAAKVRCAEKMAELEKRARENQDAGKESTAQTTRIAEVWTMKRYLDTLDPEAIVRKEK